MVRRVKKIALHVHPRCLAARALDRYAAMVCIRWLRAAETDTSPSVDRTAGEITITFEHVFCVMVQALVLLWLFLVLAEGWY